MIKHHELRAKYNLTPALSRLLWPVLAPVHELAVNPAWQFTFHAVFTVFWVITMIYVPTLSAFHGGQHFGVLAIMEVSLWANFATHFGSMSSALAAIQTQKHSEDVCPVIRVG